MQDTSLAGHTILLVEDEALIALDIAEALEKVGAIVLAAASLEDAKRLIEADGLSAAVLDFGFRDGNADALCCRLNDRNIPFVLHSGYANVGAACHRGVVVPKPAPPVALVNALVSLL